MNTSASRRALASAIAALSVAVACSADDGSTSPDVVATPSTSISDASSTPDTSTTEAGTTTTVPSEPPPDPLAGLVAPDRSSSVRMSLGMRRSVQWAAVRLGLHPTPTFPVDAYVLGDGGACGLDGQMIVAESPGRCELAINTAAGTGTMDIDVLERPERSDIDRPGPATLQLKPIYVRLADSPDLERDVNGEIAGFTQQIADWLAVQNPGFTIRVDLHDGVPDVQHVELPVTRAEMIEMWDLDIGPLIPLLRDAGLDTSGWPTSLERGNEVSPSAMKQIYVGLVEGPRGQYNSQLSTTEGGCGISSNNPFMFFFTEELDGTPCTYMGFLNYRGLDDEFWLAWDLIPRIFDTLRGHPGCDRTIGAQYEIPYGERDVFKVPESDLIRQVAIGREPPFELDPSRSFYFGITEGDRAGDPCHDIAYSHFWTDVAYDEIWPTDPPERTGDDRPDDLSGPQVRVYYVLPADGLDRRWDLDGTLDRAVRTADEWLYAQGGHHVRFDLHDGELDVGFVRLDEHEAELWMDPDDPDRRCVVACPEPRWLHQRLDELGVLTPGKIPVIVYGGGIAPTIRIAGIGCAVAYGFGNVPGGAFVSPAVREFASGWSGCLGGRETTVPETNNSLGLVIIHEVLHVLGAVDFDAPDENGTGHVSDPYDLMGSSLGPIRLDPERSNYWGHGREDITDVTRSPYLDATPPPWLPIATATPAPDPWWTGATPYTGLDGSWRPRTSAGRGELALLPGEVRSSAETASVDETLQPTDAGSMTTASTSPTTIPWLTIPAEIPEPGELPVGNVTDEQRGLASKLEIAFSTDPTFDLARRSEVVHEADSVQSGLVDVIDRLALLPRFTWILVTEPTDTTCPSGDDAPERCVTADVRLVVGWVDVGVTIRPVWGRISDRWWLMPRSFCTIASGFDVTCWPE